MINESFLHSFSLSILSLVMPYNSILFTCHRLMFKQEKEHGGSDSLETLQFIV